MGVCEPPFAPLLIINHKLLVLLQPLLTVMFFFLSTVMAILPVYTTTKVHAARINLKHLAQHLGYRSTT